jgi:hypothetical protein
LLLRARVASENRDGLRRGEVMSLAKEGWREMLLATLVLAGVGWAVSLCIPWR